MPPTNHKSLRRGYTTGACATAAAAAAAEALIGTGFVDPIEITLPNGQCRRFALSRQELGDGWARAGVVKDAGDDPDVTHGAEILVTLSLSAADEGVSFVAGEGVGTVTRPGLVLAVGEPAINPTPRRMITEALDRVAQRYGVASAFRVEVSIPNGEALAEKTLNGRLGIVGGLSILGTTGIVVPYSCSAWIDSILRGIDVARACGETHLLASTGATSESAALRHHPFPEVARLEMGDFVGGLLKYLRRNPVERLTIAGGFAKMTKLGQGCGDLHSARSQVDLDGLASLLTLAGASSALLSKSKESQTASQVLQVARDANLDLGGLVALRAQAAAQAMVGDRIKVEALVVSRQGEVIGHAPA